MSSILTLSGFIGELEISSTPLELSFGFLVLTLDAENCDLISFLDKGLALLNFQYFHVVLTRDKIAHFDRGSVDLESVD